MLLEDVLALPRARRRGAEGAAAGRRRAARRPRPPRRRDREPATRPARRTPSAARGAAARGLGASSRTCASGGCRPAPRRARRRASSAPLPEQLRILDTALAAGPSRCRPAGAPRADDRRGRPRAGADLPPRGPRGPRPPGALHGRGARGPAGGHGSRGAPARLGPRGGRSLQQALLAAVVAIACRPAPALAPRRRHGARPVPLFLAAAFTVATMVLIDIPFNFANVIVLPLLLGMGVDSWHPPDPPARVRTRRARRAGDEHRARRLLQRAHHDPELRHARLRVAPGLATIGQLLTLGVTYSLCYVVVLPALISMRRSAGAGSTLRGPRAARGRQSA